MLTEEVLGLTEILDGYEWLLGSAPRAKSEALCSGETYEKPMSKEYNTENPERLGVSDDYACVLQGACGPDY